MTQPAPPSRNDNFDEARLFHDGVTMFNRGLWFEAHETWEDLWHMAAGPRKRFYQGLIQCAVTFEHIRRGNPRGVRSVYATAVKKFDGLPTVFLGVNIPRLLNDMAQSVRPVLHLPADAFDPQRGRGQTLPVNLDNAPKINLEHDPFGVAGL